MTAFDVAVLLSELALEAKLLRKLVCLATDARVFTPGVNGRSLERAIDDLDVVASQAEALAEFIVLRCPQL
ncbi:MAG: hypothetical protein LAN62_09465 [Acidobacteriia bacterium]|nr:hypothetical protein [Terriglobia bacterium]